MLFGNLKKSFSGLQGEVKFYRTALILLVFAQMVTSCASLRREEKVTVIPPTLTEKAWVSKTQASGEYTSAWALYLGMMLGNVNPDNADIIKEAIGPILDPSIYQDVMVVLDKQIQQIRQDRVSLSFEPKKVLRDNLNPSKFYVSGYSVAEGPAGDRKRENRTYEFELVIKDYRPNLTWMATTRGDPRTQDVKDREAESAERQAKRQSHSRG